MTTEVDGSYSAARHTHEDGPASAPIGPAADESVMSAAEQPGIGEAAFPGVGEAEGRTAVGTSHAKAILFGEHAVVYGAPAVAIPLHALNATARVTPRTAGTHIHSALFRGEADDAPARVQPLLEALYSALRRTGHAGQGVDLRLDSTIPYERGLGSSAAVAVAVARAVAALEHHEFDAEDIHAVAMDAEKIAHGKSSGLDPRTVASAVPIRFLAGKVSPVSVGARLDFVLADTGRAGATGKAVSAVRRRLEAEPDVVTPLIDRLAELAEIGMSCMASGDRQALGAHMCEVHRHLAELGVSDLTLERLVDAADRAGAMGAKLTGGGRGGCVIMLARDEEHAERMEVDLRRAGATRTWRTAVEAA